MVDRINNQKYYEYSKINKQKKETTESTEFHMDLGKQGVIYEKDEKKPEKTETSFEGEKEQRNSTQSGGVKLEISIRGYEKSEKEKTKTSFIENIRKYATVAIDFFKNIWDKIWNEHTTAESAEFPEILEEQMAQKYEAEDEIGISIPEDMAEFPSEMTSESISKPLGWRTSNQIAESIYTQEEIRQIFRRGNQKEIEDFLSNHGEKHLAKSTDLLTQYNRRGILVGINNSDKELILHGNKNEIKL